MDNSLFHCEKLIKSCHYDIILKIKLKSVTRQFKNKLILKIML